MYRWGCRLAVLILLVTAGCTQLQSRFLPSQRAAEPLQVSEDGRFLLHRDGAPFFYLGDTAWELFHRLNRQEASRYLADRAEKGFTVIQAVVLAELDGLRTPNPYGEVPFHDMDPARPNEAYFEHVDYIVRRAEALGMHIGMLPTWGDKFNKKWGVGPEIFTPETARAFGRFLGERYRNSPVIWILGGDRNPETDEHLAIVRAMAEGIRAGDGGRHLMTYHPQGGSQSFQWFHDDPWLDFNMFQSGHSRRDIPNYEATAEGYEQKPVKPVLDGEPRYEDHPVDWNPEKGWFGAFDVRQAAYWSMLAGAAGHTYGDHNIWQMWEPGHEPISSARTPWQRALRHPGSTQMGYMKALFLSRPFRKLVPDQSIIVGEAGEGGAHQQAARAQDGSYLYVYTPYGTDVSIRGGATTGDTARAWWFDPRTGEAESIATFEAEDERTFDPPGRPERGNDWLLVLDDAAEDWPAPGVLP